MVEMVGEVSVMGDFIGLFLFELQSMGVYARPREEHTRESQVSFTITVYKIRAYIINYKMRE